MQQPPNYYPYPQQPVYPAPTPQHRTWLVISVVVALTIIVAGIGWLAIRPVAQSYVTPSSWIHSDPGEVMYISWEHHGSSITGDWKLSGFDSSAGAIQTNDLPFTGSISGNTVYFTVTLQGIGTVTYKGDLGFRTLTLDIGGSCNGTPIPPLVFQPGDQTAYNQALYNLEQNLPTNATPPPSSGPCE